MHSKSHFASLAEKEEERSSFSRKVFSLYEREKWKKKIETFLKKRLAPD